MYTATNHNVNRIFHINNYFTGLLFNHDTTLYWNAIRGSSARTMNLTFKLFAAYLCMIGIAWAVEWNNAPNPLIVSIQGTDPIRFMPVYIGAGDTLLGTVEFTAGYPGKTPEETPTVMTIGGGFKGECKGHRDWFYYMSSTKITCGQFNAVMKAAGKPEHPFTTAMDCPATGITSDEVQSFISSVNQFVASHIAGIPKGDEHLMTYVRLPTEAEWEFAARGGKSVDKETFDQKTPYGDQKIEDFEWVAGPTSSHNKLNPVAKLKPNPLGLYDMLGDASEMTCTPFQIEAGQGPVGGMVKRGGNYRTRGEEVRTSMRGEFSFYSVDGVMKSYPDLGFRLVLSSLIYSDVERVQEIKNKWEEYRQTRIVPGSGSERMAPLSTRLDIANAKAINTEDNTRMSQTVNQDKKITNLENQIKDINALNHRYQENIAEVAVRQASQNAHIIANCAFSIENANTEIEEFNNKNSKYNKAFEQIQKNNPTNKDVANLIFYFKKLASDNASNLLDTRSKNLAFATPTYDDAMFLLTQIDPKIVKETFIKHINNLSNTSPTQVEVTKTAMKHYEDYLKYRRYDVGKWRAELLESFKKVYVP